MARAPLRSGRALQSTFWAYALLKLLRPLGFYSLHAAEVVSQEGQRVLLGGGSGSGKSTVTLGLLREGWSCVSDDAVFLHRQPTGVEALACRKDVHVMADAASASADLPLGEAVDRWQAQAVCVSTRRFRSNR
jgi:hypothetical protein